MIQVEELVKKAKRLKGCKKGVEQLKSCKTIQEMINCLYDNIDYCIAKGFPSKDELQKLDKGIRHAAGIYIDENITIRDPKRLLLINSNVSVIVGSYNVCRAYLVGKSTIAIESSGCAITMIDALGDSSISVKANEPSKVIASLYANAKIELNEGAVKVIQKDQETYEL